MGEIVVEEIGNEQVIIEQPYHHVHAGAYECNKQTGFKGFSETDDTTAEFVAVIPHTEKYQ